MFELRLSSIVSKFNWDRILRQVTETLTDGRNDVVVGFTKYFQRKQIKIPTYIRSIQGGIETTYSVQFMYRVERKCPHHIHCAITGHVDSDSEYFFNLFRKYGDPIGNEAESP